MTLIYLGGGDVEWAIADAAIWRFEYWRLVTSCFVHADVTHLFFNLIWIAMLGHALERWLGTVRAAGLSCLLAVGSSAAEFLHEGNAGIGLSGVLYGYFGLLFATRKLDTPHKGLLTGWVIRLFLLWIFVGVYLTAAEMLPIGNFAHASGLVIGYLLGWAVRSNRRRNAKFALSVSAAVLPLMATTYMPWSYLWWWERGLVITAPEDSYTAFLAAIERAPDDSDVQGLLQWAAFESLSRGDWNRAADFYQRAIAVDENDRLSQAYMAYIHFSSGHREQAASDFRGLRREDLDEFLDNMPEFVAFVDSIHVGSSAEELPAEMLGGGLEMPQAAKALDRPASDPD